MLAITLAQKLKIKEGDRLFPVNAPARFKKGLGTLPSKAKLVEAAAVANQLHWFVVNKSRLEKELPAILKKLKPDVLL